MTRSTLRVLAALLVGFMGLLAGCQAPGTPLDFQSLRTADGQARSLVLDSSNQRQVADRAEGQGYLPWYAARNDARLAVSAGYASPTLESSVTRTIDRQDSHGGRIHDDFYRTTYSQRVRQTVR